MHQTLFFIPNQVGPYPLFGFGLLLAVWAVFSVGLLLWLGWRQGWTADTLSYVPLLLLVAAAIWFLMPVLCKPPLGLPIHSYGVMLLVAVSSAVALAAWRARRAGIDPEMVFSLAFWTFIPGILGARLFYVIEYWDSFLRPTAAAPQLGPTLGAMINVAEGGLVVYGSLGGGMLGLAVFVWKRRLPALALCDLIAPSMVLGLALGRVGCLMNGCCFGGPCHLPWAVTFPAGSPPYLSQVARGQMYGFRISGNSDAPPEVLEVYADSPAAVAGLKQGDRLESIGGMPVRSAGQAHEVLLSLFDKEQPLAIRTADGRLVKLAAVPIPPRSLKIHPTQVYSAINALLLCLFLLAYDPYCRRDGQLFAMLITLYSVTRFLLESIRIDESPVGITGLSISQNVSLLAVVFVAGLWYYVLRRPPGRAFYEAAAA
jgi:phosphatidylglycerol:prolipoprotein diacylglycerol transferase